MGLRLVITGASGFLGLAVVAAALSRGHEVVALCRSGEVDGRATRVQADLATGVPTGALTGADAVIHLAAALGGAADAQARDTVMATAQLVAAMRPEQRMVLAGSVSVLGDDAALKGTVLDEATPTLTDRKGRDAYANAKLAQEALVRAAPLAQVRVLRIGAVYGPGRLWNAHVGLGLGPVLVRLGGGGEIPLVHVDDAALALVLAAETPVTASPEVLQIVEDDLPDRYRLVDALRHTGWPALVVPADWRLWLGAAHLLRLLPLSKPGLLRPATLRARMMPVRYANARAKAALGWQPANRFEEYLNAEASDG